MSSSYRSSDRKSKPKQRLILNPGQIEGRKPIGRMSSRK